MQSIVQKMKTRMDKTLDNLSAELAKMRTGRASLSVLEGVTVESYGQQMPISHIATLNVPEPRLITIQPWDASNVAAIEKAILQAQLGLSPANDGRIIRLPIPPLTEERRKEIVKKVKKVGEDAKVALRNERRDANEEVKNVESSSEDDVKRAQQDIQKTTDNYVTKVDEMVASKEAEIMTV